MDAMTNYLEAAVLNHVLNGGSTPMAAPPSLYIALFTADPGETGSVANEITGGAYARYTITNGFTVAGIATRGYNTAEAAFPTATADWGIVTHAALMDHLTASTNMLIYGALTASRDVKDGDTFRFSANSLGITLT
jgi:hypothetical protein